MTEKMNQHKKQDCHTTQQTNNDKASKDILRDDDGKVDRVRVRVRVRI